MFPFIFIHLIIDSARSISVAKVAESFETVGKRWGKGGEKVGKSGENEKNQRKLGEFFAFCANRASAARRLAEAKKTQPLIIKANKGFLCGKLCGKAVFLS